ncbi:serine hydrolase [Flavisolibacter tropicus]|uniref:Beta-lactamase n=1 Tax=Flavisolibacter tropicus TaxID=1492898 RepID=A0A172TRZ3_9BACT|nr:serine hydrolase [Flavisolibacter tropicus]ANE49776.1 beta-lactamase [Flavisolibacter tropicus]
MKRLSLFTFLLWASQLVQAQSPSFIKDSLDSYIQKGLKDWDVPGLAIVVVKDGKVIIQKGYGVKDISTKAPVDENTLFMIASNTKLFTGTSLALLEYRGVLNLNDRITKYFPDYKLWDKTTTGLVTIRDLLSHRIGTKTFQGDFTFWNTKLTRSEIMNRMRLLKPSQVFRQDYGYCNSCFLTAGEVIPKVTGKAWENFVRDSIVNPLQMSSTLLLSTDVDQLPNVASPYTTNYTGTLQRVPFDNWNNLAPAASIVSNVKDLTNWLQMQLDSGRFNGKQVIPFQAILKTRDVQISTGSRKSGAYPMHFRGYGLGLFAADYNGRALYWHTGGAGGMVSNVCFVPEERLGIAILTNNDNQNFFETLRYQILDAYLGVPYVNRSAQQLPAFKQGMQEQLKEIAGWRSRVKGSKPTLPLATYTGTYTNELNGNITISQKGNDLLIKFQTKPDLNATLHYMDNGEWLMEYNNIEYGIFAIKFEETNSKVKSVTTRQNEFVEYDPYTFTKVSTK